MAATTTTTRITTSRGSDRYDVSTHAPAALLPQRIGARLWFPMLAMALMAFPVAIGLAAGRSAAIDDGGSATTIAALGHYVPAAMFLGFASVFGAVAFSIAWILGVFRVGGGSLQVAARRRVQTLRMPRTGKAFIGLMAVAMMTLLGAVLAHVAIGAATSTGSLALADAEAWAIRLEGIRRVGVSVYLLSIGLGLATIFTAVRFQTARLDGLVAEAPSDGSIA